MNIGASARDSMPWAMVVPPGISVLARSRSTWIHCSSQVASANLLMRSCVTSIQSLTPTSVPTAALSSSNPLSTRMSVDPPWSELHFRDIVRNRELGFRYGKHLGDFQAGRRFHERGFAAGKGDHGHIRHDEIDRPRRCQGQVALGYDLGLALGGVLHGDDDALGAAHQVHGPAHARHHLAWDHPIGEMAAGVDLQAAEHGDIDMAAAD